MIYDLPSGYSIVFIPKNGSSSVKRALNWNYDDPPPKMKWHEKLAIPNHKKGNLVAILRDPVERFLSCCSYLNWKVGKKETILDPRTYMHFHGQYPDSFITWHMRAQIEFVQNPDWFAKLYYLSEIDEFFSDHMLGEPPCCNKTSPEYKIKPTQEVIDWVHEVYKKDYELIASIKPKHRSL